MKNNSVVIIAGARIPQARQNGALLNATPGELAAVVARGATKRSGLAPDSINSVYWGSMYQTEGSSVHLPRYAAAGAGLPPTVPTAIVNRLCGSGLEAVVQGSRAIRLGESDAVLAGSTDCITRAAGLLLRPRRTLRGLSADDDVVTASTLDDLSGKRMAELAECFARASGISRAQLDHYSFHSRRRALKAQRRGLFDQEVIAASSALGNAQRPGTSEFTKDQIELRWPTHESLAALESPYGPEGRVTRGNSSAFADGAAALVLASRSFARRYNCRPLATIRSWVVTAADAGDMGGALASAMKSALSEAGLSIGQMDWVEIEEAFAVNCVFAIRKFNLLRGQMNPLGGALALGHPPASSGLRQLLCASYGLRQRRGEFALIALSAGGAQGMAMVIESRN